MSRGGKKPAAQGLVPWPALAVEKRPLRDLHLNDQNPRSHSLEQIELISDSMDKFGWTMPVLVDEENLVLAGHGRVRAARLKGGGWDEAPVIVARGWTPDMKRAYLVVDNQLAARSDWDKKALQSQLRALSAAEFDMELLGFSDEDLNKLIMEPAKLESPEGPTEVLMNRCPTCGRLSRKVGDGE